MFHQHLQKKNRKENTAKRRETEILLQKDFTSQQSRSIVRNPNYLGDCSCCEPHSIPVEISFLRSSVAKETRLDSKPSYGKDPSCG